MALQEEKDNGVLKLEKTDSSDNDGRFDEHAAQPRGDWTPEEERKIVWKVDWHVFPMLCFVFGLSLLDRTNISAAYIAGLADDLGLEIGARYSIALLIFFPGYAIFEIPSNMVIRRLGARWWLAFLIIAWGCMVLGMGFISDWRHLTVLRAFLGCFEAGLFPGGVFIIGSWYRQFETARRVSLFYMASLICSGFGPIFAYALSLISVGDGKFASGWRWIFIIEGVVTIVAGFVAPLFLIEFPEKARFLDDRQKHIATSRLLMEKQDKEVVHPNVKQSLTMLVDWKIALFGLQYFVQASSVYSLAFYSHQSNPSSSKTASASTTPKPNSYNRPPYVFAIICSLSMAWVSDKIRMRWPILIGQSLTCIVGLLIIMYAGPPGARYVGLFLAVYGSQSNIPASLAYGQNQTARPEKKGVVAAAMISIGALGGICGSSIFRSQDAPEYWPGMWSTIALQFLYIGITGYMSWSFTRQNKLAEEGKKPALEGVEGFRYAP